MKTNTQNTQDEKLFIQTIKDHFEKKALANPRFGLRAMAKFLEMDPSQLHRIMQGKGRPSKVSSLRIARKLGLSEAETHAFTESALERKLVREDNLQEIPKPNVDLEVFKLLSEWHYMAILELFYRPRKMNVMELSRKLNLAPLVFKTSCERLVKLGALKKEGNEYVATESETITPSGNPSLAIREYHKSILSKALYAIDMQPIEKRHVTSLTFAIPEGTAQEFDTLIQEFKNKVKKKVSELRTEIDHNETNIEVLNFGMQYFHLT